jgi:hypothetical protein
MLPIFIYGGTLDQRLKTAKQYLEGRHILFELDATAAKEYLNEVKALKHALALKAGVDKLAVLIIEAQHLSIPAQNALLKVLEEHDPNILIIITGAQQSSILPTLISRTEELSLKSDQITLDPIESRNILEQIFDQDINNAFDLSKKWAEEDTEQKLKLLLHIFQSHTHKNPTIERAKAIETILESYQDLSTYIPKEFILNQLFLRLRSLRRA